MRKKLWVMSAMLCMALAIGGCSGKKEVNYDSQEEDSGASAAGVTDEEGGLLADKLGIPESAEIELSTDGTNLDRITINDKDIEVPEKDRMYTKTYRMGVLTDEYKEILVRSILDEKTGIYNYSQEQFDSKDTDREYIESIFENKSSKPDFSGEYFLGKIEGVPYVVRFMSSEWSTSEAVVVSRALRDEVPRELAENKQISNVTYYDYDPDEIKEDLNSEEDDSLDKVSENVSGISLEEAEKKAVEYVNSLGFTDVSQTYIANMYRAYEDSSFHVIQYDADGYKVHLDASVNDVPLYQPMATAIDTITHRSINSSGYVAPGSYYYIERSYYEISFNEDGIMSFYGYWPMLSDDELHDAGNLITWNEAIDSLNEVIPQHFADYIGFSQVNFNNVRLTYFRVKKDEKQYEVIPVYVFSQVEDYDADVPYQLIMLDARDGSEVDIVQDSGRMGLVH